MKKNILWLVLLTLCCVCTAAFAVEEWAEFDLSSAEGDPIVCELIAPVKENAENKAILGEITDEDWSIGPEDAPLTVLEYADFQCPYCSFAGLQLISIQAAHPDEIRYVYRHFPLSFHEKAPMAAYAADAAGKQGFFFDAEHFLYEHQNDWSGLGTLDEFEAWLKENFPANIEGLDEEAWLADYESEEIRTKVDRAFDQVAATGLIGGTPTVLANFEMLETGYSEEILMGYVNLYKLQNNLKSSCPLNVVDGAHEYRAVLDTTEGEIVLNLFADDTPAAVSSFISLAAEGWYDGQSFHRIVPGFVLQTGDPSKTGFGHAGYYFSNEINENAAYGAAGMVGFANSGPDTNSAQFFITFDLNEYFNASYAASHQDASEADTAAHTEAVLEQFKENYTLFGAVSEESLDILNAVNADTIINSVKIEVREK